MKIFSVELYKIFKSKKYLLFCISLTALIIIQMFIVKIQANNERPDVKLKNNEKVLIDYRAKIKDEDISEGELNDYEKRIKKIEEENKELKEEIQNPNLNWRDKLIKKNESLVLQQKEQKAQYNIQEVEAINSQLLVNNYLLENNIPPHKPYQVSAFEDLDKIIKFIDIMFLPLLILLLSFDTISGEIQNSSIKLLLTKPVKREKIVLAKIAAAFLAGAATLIVMELLTFFFLGVIFKFGFSAYPMPVGTLYESVATSLSPVAGSTFILQSYNYLLRLLMNQVIFVLACTAFGVFISELFNNNTASLIASVLTASCVSMVTYIIPQDFLSKLYPFLFTSYADGAGLIKGSLNLKLGTTALNMNSSAAVCLVWFAVFAAFSYFRFRERDIL